MGRVGDGRAGADILDGDAESERNPWFVFGDGGADEFVGDVEGTDLLLRDQGARGCGAEAKALRVRCSAAAVATEEATNLRRVMGCRMRSLLFVVEVDARFVAAGYRRRRNWQGQSANTEIPVFARNDGGERGRGTRQRQKQKQIPSGNDKQTPITIKSRFSGRRQGLCRV